VLLSGTRVRDNFLVRWVSSVFLTFFTVPTTPLLIGATTSPSWRDFQAAPGVPEVQRALGGLLGLSRPPDLLGLADRRRRDRLYRPLPPRDQEALEALQARETNRSRPS
jgi:hypothetical protein